MSAEESAAIKAYRAKLDNIIIAWARGMRDVIHEASDEMLAQLAKEPEDTTESWRDAS